MKRSAKPAITAFSVTRSARPRPLAKTPIEMVWDHAAGVLMVEEAGGKATDLDGKPLDFSTGRKMLHNRGVLVSHGPWHDKLLDSLRRAEAR